MVLNILNFQIRKQWCFFKPNVGDNREKDNLMLLCVLEDTLAIYKIDVLGQASS